MNTRASWSNYCADGNFLFSQEQHEFFFFWIIGCINARNFSPWRNSPDGSSFPRNFRIYQCSTNGVRHNPVSTIITFLTALKAQSAWVSLIFYQLQELHFRTRFEGKCHELISPGAKAASNESARRVSSSILHLSTVPSSTDPLLEEFGERVWAFHPSKSQN